MVIIYNLSNRTKNMNYFTCEYCNNQFKTSESLRIHKYRAQYCKSLRTETCMYCDMVFFETEPLQKHIKSCRRLNADTAILSAKAEIEKLKHKNLVSEEKIQDLQLESADLKGQIKVFQANPRTVNNVKNIKIDKLYQIRTDDMKPFIKETVREALSEGLYTYKMYTKGVKGLIEFFCNLVTKEEQRSYVCTDPARGNFYRLVDLLPKNWMTDKTGKFLNDCLNMKELMQAIDKHDEKLRSEKDLEKRCKIEDKVKPVYFGIRSKKSEERGELFATLKKELSDNLSLDY